MTVSIDDLFNPPTAAEAEASIYSAMATIKLNTTAWRPNSVVRVIVKVVAIMIAAVARLISLVAKSGFLEFAVSAWLTLVARHVYGVERLLATFGTGTLTLTNTGGGIFTLDPGDLIVRNPLTDKTYTNTSLVNLGAGGTVTFAIIAQEAGSASTSSVGAITEFVTPLINVTCVNPTSVVGSDDEEDGALRLRCREVLGARSANGPADAYASIARGAKRADGSAIGVNRVRWVKDGKGNVFFYCATPTGVLSDDDLAIVRTGIQTTAVPFGVTAHTISARTRSIDVTYRVWLSAKLGATDAELAARFTTAIALHFASVPIGGYTVENGSDAGSGVWREGIEAAIKATRREIFHVEIVGMVTRIDLGSEFVPTLGTVTALEIVEAPQDYSAAA